MNTSPSAADLAPEYIRGIAPYVAGKPIDELARELGLDAATIVKLASNENPRGASPAVLAAIAGAVAELTRYPDSNGFALKDAIAHRIAVDPAQIEKAITPKTKGIVRRSCSATAATTSSSSFRWRS